MRPQGSRGSTGTKDNRRCTGDWGPRESEEAQEPKITEYAQGTGDPTESAEAQGNIN